MRSRQFHFSSVLVFCVLTAVYFVGPSVNSESEKKPSTAKTKAVPEDPRMVRPLKKGHSVPDVKLSDLKGKATELSQIYRKKPTVLVFYRGGWCPYCNTHLSDLAKIQDQIRRAGFQIVAVSPDRPEELAEAAKKNKLSYELYSDSDMEAAKAFGIAFRLKDEEVQRLKSYEIDLQEASGKPHQMLPVPSLFLISTDGQIQYQYTNADYKVRLQGVEVMAAIERVKKTSAFQK